MIQLPTKAQLKTLQAFKEPNSLSIYSPYIKPNSPDNNPNRTQLKNLLKESRQLLLARKLSEREIEKLLKPAKKLLDGDEFRQNHKHSLALFIGQDFFQYYHLPSKGVELSTTVSHKFYTQPIVKLSEKSPSYFALILSHNGAKLLRGNRYNIEQIQDFPTAMKQDLRIDEYPKERQTHSVAPASQGKGSEKFHGQYNKAEVDKDMLVKFFRHINDKMYKIMKKDNLPLAIAGVDYLLPLYRQVNTYPNLLKKDIQGNFEHSSLNNIRKHAFKLLTQ